MKTVLLVLGMCPKPCQNNKEYMKICPGSASDALVNLITVVCRLVVGINHLNIYSNP